MATKEGLDEMLPFHMVPSRSRPPFAATPLTMKTTAKTKTALAAFPSPVLARRSPTTKKGTIRFYALPLVETRIQIERWAATARTPGRVLDDLVEHAKVTGFTPRAR